MILCLGQYLLLLDWKQDYLSFPSFEYNKKKETVLWSDSEKLVLHVSEGALPSKNRCIEGWNWLYTGNSWQAVYCKEGNSIFSLHCEPQAQEAEVIVQSPEKSAVRLGVQYGMMTALSSRCIGLHGVTLLCGDEIVILSAPSGTGKTTLAHLLETYCDAITINGDFALLSVSEEGVVFEPTPFCGSSGRCLNHRLRVNRVVFLEQAKTNQWRDLTGREAITRFMSNTFVPTWDPARQHAIQENIVKCVSMVKVNAYAFAPTQEAAYTFLRKLEEVPAFHSE